MILVALTGGIGSGKSTVAGFFERLNVPIFYADAEAKSLLIEPEVKNNIINLLGKKSYLTDGKPNKKYISSIIFNDKKINQQINNIIHPLVFDLFMAWCEKQDTPYVIKESALIFESGFEKEFDTIITVTAPPNLRVERILKNGYLTEQEIMQRVKAQISNKEKSEHSDFVINNIELIETEEAVKEIHKALMDITK